MNRQPNLLTPFPQSNPLNPFPKREWETDTPPSLLGNGVRRLGFLFIAILSLAAASPPLIDKRGDIEARATLDTDEIRLSGEAKLTVTIEAPGPLSVTQPKPLLIKAGLWRIREDGQPTREIAGQREKWTQVYRLSPLIPGKPEIALGSYAVRAGDGRDVALDWNNQSLTVQVKTAIESPSLESLRPATDVEQLPPPPKVESTSSPWWYLIVLALLMLAGALVYFARRKRTPATPRDAAWVLKELSDDNLSADRCAAVLRQFLAYRFSVPAEMRTTPELANALRGHEQLSVDVVTEWELLLKSCDAVRFSGSTGIVPGLVERARALVTATESTFVAT